MSMLDEVMQKYKERTAWVMAFREQIPAIVQMAESIGLPTPDVEMGRLRWNGELADPSGEYEKRQGKLLYSYPRPWKSYEVSASVLYPTRPGIRLSYSRVEHDPRPGTLTGAKRTIEDPRLMQATIQEFFTTVQRELRAQGFLA